MSRNLIIVLSIFGGLIVVCGVGILLIMRLLELPMYVDRTISSNVPVTNEWTELTPDSPMRVLRDFQSVEVEIKGAYTTTKRTEGPSLFLPDGTPVSPEVKIQDDKGNWYDLNGGSYGIQARGDGSELFDVWLAGFHLGKYKLPKDKTFKSIRIKSDKPFICEKVIWRNYNLK